MHIFSGLYKGKAIQTPKGLDTRPTAGRLRETLFNICQNDIEGTHFLDLFAGSGAMGLEALSRGAASVTFVDSSRESIRCIQENVNFFNIKSKVKILHGDVFEMLQKLSKIGFLYGIIYADPPYGVMSLDSEGELPYSVRTLKIIDQNPNSFLAPDGLVFIEESAGTIPDLLALDHLRLENSRQMGRSSLHKYRLNPLQQRTILISETIRV